MLWDGRIMEVAADMFTGNGHSGILSLIRQAAVQCAREE